jgi:hypothetical protein
MPTNTNLNWSISLRLLLTVSAVGMVGLTGCSIADETVRHDRSAGGEFIAGDSKPSTQPVISSSSEDSFRLNSASVVRAAGGGSYVVGTIEPSFGYDAPRGARIYVAAYDARGKLLAEKVDEIAANELVASHLTPTPRAPYAVFFPWEPSQIAKVSVRQKRSQVPPA